MGHANVHFRRQFFTASQFVGQTTGLWYDRHDHHLILLGDLVRLVAQERAVLVKVVPLEHPLPDVLVGDLALQFHEKLDHLQKKGNFMVRGKI